MKPHAIILWGAQNFRKVFLIDAAGAALSAFLLGVVLVHFHTFFGIPVTTLYLLAAIPTGFVIYDVLCSQLPQKKSPPFLRGIAILNLSYCVLSVSLTIWHAATVSFWGWYYIISEVLLVALIAFWELKVSQKLNSQYESVN